MIKRAIEFAAKAHHGQFRKGTDIPYIAHPFNVAAILAKSGVDDELVAAGALHDTVEDVETVNIVDIRREFGDRVADIVGGCSEPDKGATWQERKQHTINYLKSAPMDVKFVSCADKLDNMTSIARDYEAYGETLWQRFKVGMDDQAWYYSSLVESFDTPGFNETALFRAFQHQVGTVFNPAGCP